MTFYEDGDYEQLFINDVREPVVIPIPNHPDYLPRFDHTCIVDDEYDSEARQGGTDDFPCAYCQWEWQMSHEMEEAR